MSDEEHKTEDNKPEHKSEHEHKHEHKKAEHKHEHKPEHKHHKPHKTHFKLNTYVVLIIIGIVLLGVVQAQIISLNTKIKIISGPTTKSTGGAVDSNAPEGAPTLSFYVMSYCPYGNQAEEGIAPVYELLKGEANFEPHYVIYSNYQGGGPQYCLDAESKYCSMHGIQELNQNFREQCVAKYMGMDAFFDFAIEMNTKCNSNNADTCWEPVAAGLGLDTAKIKTCEAEEALDFAAADSALNQQLGVRGSPSVFINGESYSGGRAPGDYLKALCAEFDVPPAGCGTQLQASAPTAQGSC